MLCNIQCSNINIIALYPHLFNQFWCIIPFSALLLKCQITVYALYGLLQLHAVVHLIHLLFVEFTYCIVLELYQCDFEFN